MNRIRRRLQSQFRVQVINTSTLNENIIYTLERRYPDIYNDILRNLEGDVNDDIQNILLMQEVIKILKTGKKIGAIKYVRSQTGMGLKEAKDYVELFQIRVAEENYNQYNTIFSGEVSEDALEILESYREDYPEYFI